MKAQLSSTNQAAVAERSSFCCMGGNLYESLERSKQEEEMERLERKSAAKFQKWGIMEDVQMDWSRKIVCL